MIRFTTLLLAHSRRWLAPLLFGLVWTSIAMNPEGGGSSVSRAAGMLPCYVIVGCWLSIIIGSIDDDAHRELVTAEVGSRRRVHIIRVTAGLLIGAGAAAVISLLGLLLFSHERGWLAAIAVTCALLLLLFFLLPPMQDVLRRGGVDDTSRVAPLFDTHRNDGGSHVNNPIVPSLFLCGV